MLKGNTKFGGSKVILVVGLVPGYARSAPAVVSYGKVVVLGGEVFAGPNDEIANCLGVAHIEFAHMPFVDAHGVVTVGLDQEAPGVIGAVGVEKNDDINAGVGWLGFEVDNGALKVGVKIVIAVKIE